MGNTISVTKLVGGETVIDLGSGRGFDCFLAAKGVGPTGKVIGVDMALEMITKARYNLTKTEYTNIEFRLGEIEHLPIPDNTADVVFSNCIVNLSSDKPAVYAEALRVLKPEGRVSIADILVKRELSQKVKEDMRAKASCVEGAITEKELINILKEAGFINISVQALGGGHSNVFSAYIEAIKPA